jgi:hypothetical protein
MTRSISPLRRCQSRCFGRALLRLLAMLLTFPAAARAERRKAIVDQDAFGPGGSNMQSLLLPIQSPDVAVLGITIVSGDGWNDENVAHTLRMLELIGRTDNGIAERCRPVCCSVLPGLPHVG